MRVSENHLGAEQSTLVIFSGMSQSTQCLDLAGPPYRNADFRTEPQTKRKSQRPLGSPQTRKDDLKFAFSPEIIPKNRESSVRLRDAV